MTTLKPKEPVPLPRSERVMLQGVVNGYLYHWRLLKRLSGEKK